MRGIRKMIGTVIFLAVAAVIIYLITEDEKTKKEAARKKAQEAQEKQRLEQQVAQQIQVAELKISNSEFYQKLLSCLNDCIQKDIKTYLAKSYKEYIKNPGAVPNRFNPLADKKEFLPDILGDIDITLGGIHNGHSLGLILRSTRTSSLDNRCDVQVDFARNGYSDMNPLQMWAFAQRLSRDLGYQFEFFYVSNGGDEESISCENIREDAVRYMNLTQRYVNAISNQEQKTSVEIRICPHFITDDFNRVIDSETCRLQNSGISYKSPF